MRRLSKHEHDRYVRFSFPSFEVLAGIVCCWVPENSPASLCLELEIMIEGAQAERGDEKVKSIIGVDGRDPPEYGNGHGLQRLCNFSDSCGRISSMDFHKPSSYLVTASDDESIRLYDVASATCLKTINSKKYGVDLVSFTSHPTTVIYSSKNGWDESLWLLSLNDSKYLRYFKGHHDRFGVLFL
ncbi:unnamed protein product [Linum tenue]|uniref:Uncharacterized protein n=1 Tax=Linum tenue TaxID=586396 RepID=A0AAV0NU58_9ROSI|nr:unnamed protein product [Linum tenue]